MSEDPQWRPDGRPVTAETLRLRNATRALRLHLDQLPIDYNLDVPGDQFLAGLGFMFARQRYACADSMIGAGFGGTVIGSMARSLFVTGLRWLWIGGRRDRRRAFLGELRDERNRLLILLEQANASCGNLPRWLMPLPDIADLTGQSLNWIDSPSLPSEEELLDEFLDRRGDGGSEAGADDDQATLLAESRKLLDMTGLRGAVMVLAHAGHGNYLGLQSSLTDDGAAGHDLRSDHEALYMHAAAAGVTASLIGTAASVPECWPNEVPTLPFLERAVILTEDVCAAAVPIHRLDTARRPIAQSKKKRLDSRAGGLLRPGVVVPPSELLPDVNSTEAVIEAAEDFYRTARGLRVRPWDCGQPALHAMLAYGGGHSNLQTVFSTYDQPGSSVIAVFAARMLLEEAARMVWRYSVKDWTEFTERAKQYFDEFRSRRKRAIDTLAGSGVPRADAERIFDQPETVLVITPIDEIAKNRLPLPPIGAMLREMGAAFHEPGWLEVAYSLLSQIVHSTSLGHLHTVQFRDGIWHGNELTPEMLGLTLDAACLGSAHLLGLSARHLMDGAEDAVRYHKDLLRRARDVHSAARWVHGLD
ncbi:hypothetical protein ACQEVB_40725 [Pseudonocardia sp. CA-107938]|uniref:hypothetical protein n=1 Tax=Pseudonocardia sp. CA-107938 TaxID=3240021 RepID=UPI003D8A5766